LSPKIFGHWIHLSQNADEAARQITLSRLYYIYFGLFFLGTGSAMFAVFCPIDIKNNASVREYLKAEGDLVTRARMGLIIPNIARQYVLYSGDDSIEEKPNLTARLSESTEFTSLFHEAIIEMYSAIPNEHDSTNEDQQYSSEDDRLFCDNRGRPDPYKIAAALYRNIRAYQFLTYEIQNVSASPNHKNDVLTLQYLALDHSRPWSRVIVIGTYALGFALLFIPTMGTFFNIVTQLLFKQAFTL
jgi:hypothetical protein